MIVAIAAVSVALPLAAWSVLAHPDRVRQQSVANLQRGLDARTPGAFVAVGQRGGFRAFARRLTPAGHVRRIDRLLARAGRPPGWPLDRVLSVKLVLLFSFVVGNLFYISVVHTPIVKVIAVTATLCAYFLPELLLQNRGIKRRDQIQLELADTLDQMTIAVEAGLGFDSAMARAGKNGKGPLAEELVRTLQDIQLGQSRRQAYEAFLERVDVPDLRRFLRAVIQADMYGIAVGDVLRTQAAEMRLKRRQRAEEKAMQIPVKVIFPLIMCILPVLFIVLLGPAAMDIVAAFTGGGL
ncbi:type II secretion system F family protein [Georgenia ruanii]|uniref:Type II secretion system F family protein n=1 Tax=Georgenia ruanii TaxID=348442 RepID=A0A7J9V0E3_9MICO|nr:type II secretion system F family protein [Georgenia ruanii]